MPKYSNPAGPALKALLIGLSLLIVPTAFALPIEKAHNLQLDAVHSAAQARPIVFFITASDCPYCEILRENLFQFLPDDPRFVLREVVMDANQPVIGFAGEALTHRQLARQYAVDFSPTVLFLGPNGKPLSEALIGVLTLDYYRYYFDQSLEQATRRLRKSSQTQATPQA